jgi:DNA repair protein RecO (recombination protein O)
MRHVVLGNPKRLFSFRLGELDQKRMNDTCEAFVLTQLERGFSTLDFYKMLTQGSAGSARG